MFDGFNELTNEFLVGIRFNNNKEWFGEHKEMYRQNVHMPISELAEDIYSRMHKAYPDFEERPKISRVNRDIRFSKNKNPYKECKWFFLRADGKPDIVYSRPTFFFEMSPDWWRYGFFFAPNPAGMQAYRKRIDAHPAEMKKIIDIYNSQNVFEMSGENYKRIFNKELGPCLTDWYQKKYLDFVSMHGYSEKIFYKAALADKIFNDFKTVYPIYEYFDSIGKNGVPK